MAKKLLVNRKTGKEFSTLNAESLLAKYPRTFIVKEGTELLPDILEKDLEIQNEIENVEVDFEEVTGDVVDLKSLKRAQLDSIAIEQGLDPTLYTNKSSLIKAINDL